MQEEMDPASGDTETPDSGLPSQAKRSTLMSEFWVSKKKYYCQYCEIYIADDAPSRAQHENGLRHKGNKDRFIRGLYKTGVKKKQESEEEKREMKRVEEAAQAAYARDIGAGLVTPGASSSTAPVPAAKPKPPPPKPSDPYANYTTAASLGFTDPDVDRLFTETELRRGEGRAGDWVAVVPPPPPLPEACAASADCVAKLEPGTNVGDVRKRADEPVDEEDTRHFKMRKKSAALGLGEIYDPGIIRVRPRIEPDLAGKSESISLSNSMPSPGPTLGADVPQCDAKSTDLGPTATAKPEWTRREWKRTGEDARDEDYSAQSQTNGATDEDELGVDAAPQEPISMTIKSEVHEGGPDPEAPNETKKEDPIDSELLSGVSSGLFRKRKARGSTATRERRQL